MMPLENIFFVMLGLCGIAILLLLINKIEDLKKELEQLEKK